MALVDFLVPYVGEWASMVFWTLLVGVILAVNVLRNLALRIIIFVGGRCWLMVRKATTKEDAASAIVASANTEAAKSGISPIKQRRRQKKPRWMEDGETSVCCKCATEFTLFTRRHHCRICLKIYCDNCSSKRYNDARACDRCYNYKMKKNSPEEKKDEVKTICNDLKKMVSLRDSKWIEASEADNVKVYKQELEVGTCVMGIGEIPQPPSIVLDLVTDINRKCEFDSMFKLGKRLEEITEFAHVVYQEFQKPFMVSARDFVNLSVIEVYKDGSCCVAARSRPHKDMPPRSGLVRGNVQLGGYLIEPVSGTEKSDDYSLFTTSSRCRVTFLAKVDLCGSLPSAVTNQVSVKQPMQVATIRNILANVNPSSVDVSRFERARV